MAWVASLFPPLSISWGSCTDDQAVLFIEVVRLFWSFCSVQNILYRICCSGQHYVQVRKIYGLHCKARAARFGRGQARPVQERPLLGPAWASPVSLAQPRLGVSLISAHLHAQNEVRVEAAAGYLTGMPAMTACSGSKSALRPPLCLSEWASGLLPSLAPRPANALGARVKAVPERCLSVRLSTADRAVCDAATWLPHFG